jgi:hypothetical protein
LFHLKITDVMKGLGAKEPDRFALPFEEARAALSRAEEAVTALEDFGEAAAKKTPDAQNSSFGAACDMAKNATSEAEALKVRLASAAEEVEELCKNSCAAERGAFCIDVETGEPFCRGELGAAYQLPKSIPLKSSLALRVMGPKDTEGAIELVTTFVHLSDTLTKEGSAKSASAPARYIQLKELVATVPDDSSIESLQISFKRTKPGSGEVIAKSYKVAIDRGKYYLEIGLLVPFVVNGSTVVGTTPLSGTGGEQRITVFNDSIVSPAVAVNLFPGGRRKGRVSSFDPWSFWDFVGLQAGVDIDLAHAFDRVYGGLALEPVAGISLNLGIAAIKSQLVPESYAEGMLLPKGETLTPRTEYLPRFYFGVTVTTDVQTTIVGAVQAARAQASKIQ